MLPKINSEHGSDTRNILNRAIDSINAQGKSIQDLVAEGQLTPAQYAELIQSVNALPSHTDLDEKRDKDIKITPEDLSNSALSLLDEKRDKNIKITPEDLSNSALSLIDSKRDKDVKIAPEDLSDSALSLVTGEGVINLNSIPQDGSVKARTLSSTYNHKGNLSSNDDLNHVVDTGFYVFVSSNNAPANLPSGLLSVESSGTFVIQTVQTIQGDSDKVYRRVTRPNASEYSPWFSLHNPTGLSTKSIVNLGDSIFGNTRGVNSVSNRIFERTGATVHNIGFGGSRIAEHFAGWDAFSLYRLADEIVKDDTDATKWQIQEVGIIDDAGGAKASYFRNHLDLLKTIDFNQVDFITIAGGTNDYTASVLLDNETDKYDTTTFAGSLRYSLEKIMGKFKHLKILLCTPTYRFWMDESGAFVEDSDTRLYGGQGLPDFVQKEIEVAREYHVPVVDNYFELGINKFNRQEFFPNNDGTHPNPKGNEKLGNRIGSKLISEF